MSENSNSEHENFKPLSIQAKVEALLFAAPSAVTVKQIADAIESSPKEVENAVAGLEELYSERGIQIQKNRGKYQLTSAPEAARYIEKMLSLENTSRLSQAAIETLAIIAYQQPITRPIIDNIRGVSSDGVLRNLLSKGLIEESGRSEGPGRPILYITSSEFLQHFGLNSLKTLPPLNIPEVPETFQSEQSKLPLAAPMEVEE